MAATLLPKEADGAILAYGSSAGERALPDNEAAFSESPLQQRTGSAAWADRMQQLQSGQHHKATYMHAELRVRKRHHKPEIVGVVILAAAILCTMLAVGIALDRLGAQGVETPLPTLAVYVCVPWLLATVWLLHVAIQGLVCDVVHAECCAAARSQQQAQPWNCSCLAGYLLMAPALTALTTISQVLSILTASFTHSRDEKVPMGCMLQHRIAHTSPWSAFAASSSLLLLKQQQLLQQQREQQEDPLGSLLRRAAPRRWLLLLQALTILLGMGLLAFGGSGGQCEAGLWWAAASFTVASALLLVSFVAALHALHPGGGSSRPQHQARLESIMASPPDTTSSTPLLGSPAEPTANLHLAASLTQAWKATGAS